MIAFFQYFSGIDKLMLLYGFIKLYTRCCYGDRFKKKGITECCCGYVMWHLKNLRHNRQPFKY
jgi:hypothetical protein